MKEELERTVTFTEEMVAGWCERSGEPINKDGFFENPAVPEMMVLDQISGMLKTMADEDEHVVISSLTAVRFRDPIYYGEEVTLSCELNERDEPYRSFDVSARTTERDELSATGAIMVVVQGGN